MKQTKIKKLKVVCKKCDKLRILTPCEAPFTVAEIVSLRLEYICSDCEIRLDKGETSFQTRERDQQ